MKKYKDIILSPNSSIKEALKIIDKGGIKIALVVDKENKLLGTVSDGDIRRAILKDYSLNCFVDKIMAKKPLVCKKNDSKEKILDLALEKKIYQIPIVDENGFLIGIKELNELIKKERKKNKVVLMVGGLGKRLKSLTKDTPKPMLKVGDRPILETIILNFKKYGFKDIILSVSYKSDIIIDYFKDGSDLGVNIEYIHEKKRMGTAGSLSLIKKKFKEDFFVMNGDLLTNINFEHMMNYHKRNNAYATMGVREYSMEIPYGVLDLDGISILEVNEKPRHSFYVNAGIYILNPEIINFVPKDKFFDMTTLFRNMIKKNMKAISFPIREYWLDIGKLDEYKRANKEYFEVF